MQSAFQDIGFTGCFAIPGDFIMIVAVASKHLSTDLRDAQCCAVAPITVGIGIHQEQIKM
jgi:hypothetical protein